ncbi:MAG: RimK family alpha-L-glutamate ligase [Nanoarchaeota archaeon]|nr:RimK family alpha-L-glutamate ligase [Nanoarchaeota archaeon]
MVSIAILAPKAKSETTNILIKAAKKMFKIVDHVPIKEVALEVGEKMGILYKDESLLDYDYILPRIDSKRASFGYQIIKMLDFFHAKKPYPAESILIAHNKFATIFEIKKHNIPVPKTFYTASKKSANEIIDLMSFPVVIKLVGSFGGKGVLFVEGETAARSVFKTLDVLKQNLLIEEYIKNPGEDIRGIVAGDVIAGSFKRIAKKGEKRTNFMLGGKVEDYKLTKEEEEICFKVAEAVKSKIIAVDMIKDKDGAKVIEVNLNPGLKAMVKTKTGKDAPEKILRFCHNETKK